MEISVRSYLNAGIALTAASAIALTPVVISPSGGPLHLPTPYISTSEVHLAAAISPADVAALVSNLDAAMGSVTATVSALVDGSGQTLTDALRTAAGLNDNLWDGLIRAAGANPTLGSVMIALKAASAGGLSALAASVDAAGATIALSSGQVAGLLTSTVTGSLGSAMQAVTSVVNDPLSAASYLGLLTTPFGIAGMALQGGINAVAALATGGVELASTLVTGVTAQIDSALSLVNGVLDAGKSLTDLALVDGALTAVQGIVSAPVTAALAGVNGITGAVADVATFALGAVAGGASGVVSTWLGDSSSTGALERAIAAIGSAPLSPASYTDAIGVLLGAGFSTVKTVAGTVSSFASLPFRVGADLTNTGAAVITSFTNGLADAATGLLHAVGLSPFVSGLPRALATAVTSAVKVAAFATSAALNTIAAAIDFGQAVGGIFDARTSTLSATAAGPAALPTSGLRTALISASAETQDADSGAETATAQNGTKPAAPVLEPGTGEFLPKQVPGSPETAEADVELPAAAVEASEPAKESEGPVSVPTGTGVDESAAGDAATTDADSGDEVSDTAIDEPAKGATGPRRVDQAESSTETGRHATSTRVGAAPDDSESESYGRHASGTTASESSSSGVGRHRSDAAPSPSTNGPTDNSGSSSASANGDRAAA